MRNSVGKHVLEKKKSASCAPRGALLFEFNSELLDLVSLKFVNVIPLLCINVINFTGVMQVTNICYVYQYQLSISIVPFHFSAILCNVLAQRKLKIQSRPHCSRT